MRNSEQTAVAALTSAVPTAKYSCSASCTHWAHLPTGRWGVRPPRPRRNFSFPQFTRALYLTSFVTASKARAGRGKRPAARHDDGHSDAGGDEIRPAFLGRSQRPRQHRGGDSSSEEEEEEHVTPPGKGKGSAAKARARARTAAMRRAALSAPEEDSYDSSGPGDASQKGEHHSSSEDTEDDMPSLQPDSADDYDSGNEAAAREAGSGGGGAGGGGAAAPAAQPPGGNAAPKKKARAARRLTSVIDRADINNLIHCDIDVETGGAIPGIVQLTCVFSIDGKVRRPRRAPYYSFTKKKFRAASVSFFLSLF